jgi:hypothetical protein
VWERARTIGHALVVGFAIAFYGALRQSGSVTQAGAVILPAVVAVVAMVIWETFVTIKERVGFRQRGQVIWQRRARHHLVPLALVPACVLLVSAVGWDHGSGFYQFLRVVTCIAAVAGIAMLWTWDFGWRLALGVIAILYNPLVPVQLGERSYWQVINTLTVGAFGVVMAAAFIEILKPVDESAETADERQPEESSLS